MSYRPPPLPPRPSQPTPSAPPLSQSTAPPPPLPPRPNHPLALDEDEISPPPHRPPPLPPIPSQAQIQPGQFESPQLERKATSNISDDSDVIASPSVRRKVDIAGVSEKGKKQRYSYIEQNILPRHLPQPGSIEEYLYSFLQDHEDPTLRYLQTVEVTTRDAASTIPGVMKNQTSSDMFTLLAFAIHGDAKLSGQVKSHIITSLRALADWLEAPKKDLCRVVSGMTSDDLDILLRWLVPPSKPIRVNATGDIAGATDVKAAKDKHKTEVHRNATTLRKISNQLNQHEHSGGPHPTIIGAIVAALYKRGVVLFENAGCEILTSRIFPVQNVQLPIYLAFANYDSSVVHLLVPQEELHVPQTPVEMVALVPAYNESEEELMRTWQSFKNGCTEPVQVIFFVDGIHKDGRDINHGTLQALLNNFDLARVGRDVAIGKDSLQVLLSDVDTVGDELNATMEYMGFDRAGPKGHVSVRVWIKKNNSGKKQSQLKFFEHITKRSIRPRYQLFVDSDTQFSNPAVSELKNALKNANEGAVVPVLGGITGEIEVENMTGGYCFMGCTQYFEYKMSHHLGKRAEAIFGRVSCLAGAFSMFETRALMDPKVMTDFAKPDSGSDSLWQYNKKNLGEDRYLTAQLLEAGYETGFEPRAKSSTVVPDTLRGFIAQRRRWDNSTLVNQVDLIMANKESVFSLWGGRYTLPWVWNLLDFIFSLFMPGNMLLLISSLFISLQHLTGSSLFGSNNSPALICPILGAFFFLMFFLLPLLVKKPWVLTVDLFIVKVVCLVVVASTGVLFAYMANTAQIWLIVVATWVFCGPYVVAIFLRKLFMCIPAGLLFLCTTPVMFLFLKFYALANFGERSWGTRGDKAAADNSQKLTQVAIGMTGVLYALINAGYIALALIYPSYFMYVFVLLVCLTATTRLVASFAVRQVLNKYRRLLGTVAMFDFLSALGAYLIFRVVLKFDFHDVSVDSIFSKEYAVIFLTLARSLLLGTWFCGMRRSGWFIYIIGVGITAAELAFVFVLGVLNYESSVLGIMALVYLLVEGVLIWKTLSNKTSSIMTGGEGVCFWLAVIHNVLFISIVLAITMIPSSASHTFNITGSFGAPVILLPLSLVCAIWIFLASRLCTRASAATINAICAAVVYLIGIVIVGKLVFPGGLSALDESYYPYFAVLSMIFTIIEGWSGVRWSLAIKARVRETQKALSKDADVDEENGVFVV